MILIYIDFDIRKEISLFNIGFIAKQGEGELSVQTHAMADTRSRL